MISILIAILSATAAIFAALFFHDRKRSSKYESKAEQLNTEIADLRCKLARQETICGGYTEPLYKDALIQFLRKEKTNEVELTDDGEQIVFTLGGERYHISTLRLPQQFILRKGWNLEGSNIHFDILGRAAAEVTDGLVMVKVRVIEDDSYDFLIVSADHSVASLRENFDFYMSLIADGERKLREEYWRIMEIEHPEECHDSEENKGNDMNEMAMRMAHTGTRKIQS